MISWAGMRGIVTLAAALALPSGFPFRDLIVLTAFCVVLGTLTIQGLTLKPLLRALDLRDDDPVGQERRAARDRALKAGLASLEHDPSPAADAVRQEFTAHLEHDHEDDDGAGGEGPGRSTRGSTARRSRRRGRPSSPCARARDRRRCLPRSRRGAGLARDGRRQSRKVRSATCLTHQASGCSTMLDSWDRNNTILVNLLRAIPPGGLDIRATGSSPSIGQMFMHMHYVRLIFVHEDAPEFAVEVPRREWLAERDVDRMAQMLNDSAAVVRAAVMGKLASGRAMDKHYDHPILLMQHMVWHEGYHHGQIKLALKLAGYPFDDEEIGQVTWDVWLKKSRAR